MADTNYPNEIWKTIPFAPDYSASDQGRVMRTVPDQCGRFGNLIKSKRRGPDRNYVAVGLTVDGRTRTVAVHRAVAFAFLGAPKGDANHVAHNDGDPTNNRLINLRWTTRAENMADCLKHGTKRQGEKVNTAKLTKVDVQTIRESEEPRRVLAERYRVTVRNIGYIQQRVNWKHVL